MSAAAFRELPTDVAALAEVVQGLCVYDVMAESFYGYKLPKRREAEIHLRTVEEMLRRIFEMDPRPLSEPRPVGKRLAARCGQFTALMVAMLRAKGIRARARGGFGAYFNAPYFEDHWVCEYWRSTEGRWALADAQFDAVWREKSGVRHDVLDVPRDQFLVAGEAWRRCRSGEADPGKFGIVFAGLRGLWFVAGSLVRDVAALNGVQTLPWDVWGAMPKSGQELGGEALAFFDRLAELSASPEGNLAELERLYETDPRVRVPPTVFNALLNRAEALS